MKHSGLLMKTEPKKIEYEGIAEASLNIANENCSFIEGQIVKHTDEIAQRTHDLEDGFRTGIIDYGDIEDVELVEFARNKGNIAKPRKRQDYRPMGMIVRNLIHILVSDLIENSRILIEQYETKKRIANSEDFYEVKRGIEELVDLSPDMKNKFTDLDTTINDHIINSERVNRMDARASYFIKDLFKAYFNEPRQLPSYLLHRYEHFFSKPYLRKVHYKEMRDVRRRFQEDKNFLRMICDHISGMTDNFALSEHEQLYLSTSQIK